MPIYLVMDLHCDGEGDGALPKAQGHLLIFSCQSDFEPSPYDMVYGIEDDGKNGDKYCHRHEWTQVVGSNTSHIWVLRGDRAR